MVVAPLALICRPLSITRLLKMTKKPETELMRLDSIVGIQGRPWPESSTLAVKGQRKVGAAGPSDDLAVEPVGGSPPTRRQLWSPESKPHQRGGRLPVSVDVALRRGGPMNTTEPWPEAEARSKRATGSRRLRQSN